MKNGSKYIAFVLLILSLNTRSQISELKSETPQVITDFKLLNVDGHVMSLTDNQEAKGYIIVFTCNHCPFAKLYPKRFNALNKKYKKRGVPLIAINSMDTVMYEEEGFEAMQKKASQDKLNFPYLYDPHQGVGKMFNAEHTPQAFVIWKENGVWIIKYNGAIDDNGEHPESAKPYIANAVDELLKGQAVTLSRTPSFGCRIFYRKQAGEKTEPAGKMGKGGN